MVCRNKERAESAREEIVAETKNNNLHILLGDCSLERDVRRVWAEFTNHQMGRTTDDQCVDSSNSAQNNIPRLDALICNAGALLNTKTLTDEGVEVTFAAHFLFGTYLLGQFLHI